MTDLFSKCFQNMSDSQYFHEWVVRYLPNSVNRPGKLTFQALNGDAGFRQYFRLNTTPSLIAVSAPPEHENNPAFVQIALLLKQHGLHTPNIYAVDYHHGYLLLEDLGNDVLLPLLSPSTVGLHYQVAETALLSLQQIPIEGVELPNYDRQRLLDEMALFPQWFLVELLGVDLNEAERKLIDTVMEHLAASALEQPQVIVHRDFHSRNLMALDDDIAVIDFQDAVVGPLTYDLVSLLRDCYIRWPRDYVMQRVRDYYGRAVECGIAEQVSDTQLCRWFDWMGLQRHIKVLGIFARLWLRDGKRNYLNDLPLVIRYTLEQMEPYPELQEFKQWFERRVLPLLPEQDWYQPWEMAGDSSKG